MSEPEPVQYTHGDIVWVKLRFCWWPGEVVEYDKLPENVRDELQFKKMPLAIVTFFQEDSYEYIKNTNHIFSYNCLRKDEFIKKGMDLQRAKNPFMKKFSSDIIVAEKMTHGNENILSDPKYGPPKPKESYEGIFPSPNKKPKDKLKRLSGKGSPGRKKAAEPFVTHPRFVGHDDHQVRMLIQSPDKVQEQVDNNTYTCQTCGFSSNRLGVIMIHNKTHISSPGMGKKAKRTPIKKVNKRGPFRIPHSNTSSIDEDIARIEQGLSITEDDFSSHEDEEDEDQPKVKRKKVTLKGKKSGKKPKVDSKAKEEKKTDIRVDLLAEWDDEEEEGTEEKVDESATKVEDKATEDKAATNEDAFSAAVEEEKVSDDKTISEDKSTEVKESTSEEVDKSSCDFKETQEKVDSETTVNLDKRKSAEPTEDPNLPTAEDDANRTIDNQSNSETLTEKTTPEPDTSSFKELMETTTLPELPEMPATLKCEQNFHNSKTIKFPDKTESPPASATKLTNPKKRFVKSFEETMEKENGNKKSKIDPVVEDTPCKSIVLSNKSFEDFQCSLLNTGIVTETETLLKDEQIGASSSSSMEVDMVCASPIDKKIDKMDSKKETRSSKKDLKLKSDVLEDNKKDSRTPTRELRRDKKSKDSKDVSIKVTEVLEEKKEDVKVKEQKPEKVIAKEEDSKFHGRRSLREKRQSKLTREASKESDVEDKVVEEIEEPPKQELESKIILEEKAKEDKNGANQKAKMEGKSGKKKVKTVFEEEIKGKREEVKEKSSGLKDIKNIDAEEEAKPKKEEAKNVKKLDFEAALESADTVFNESKRRKKHSESQTKDKPEVEKSKKSSKIESAKHDLQDDLPNKAGKSNRLSKGADVKVKKVSKVETDAIEKTIKEDTEKSKSKISETVREPEKEKRDKEEEPEKEEILNETKQIKKLARASKNDQKDPEDVVENIDFTPSKRKKTSKLDVLKDVDALETPKESKDEVAKPSRSMRSGVKKQLVDEAALKVIIGAIKKRDVTNQSIIKDAVEDKKKVEDHSKIVKKLDPKEDSSEKSEILKRNLRSKKTETKDVQMPEVDVKCDNLENSEKVLVEQDIKDSPDLDIAKLQVPVVEDNTEVTSTLQTGSEEVSMSCVDVKEAEIPMVELPTVLPKEIEELIEKKEAPIKDIKVISQPLAQEESTSVVENIVEKSNVNIVEKEDIELRHVSVKLNKREKRRDRTSSRLSDQRAKKYGAIEEMFKSSDLQASNSKKEQQTEKAEDSPAIEPLKNQDVKDESKNEKKDGVSFEWLEGQNFDINLKSYNIPDEQIVCNDEKVESKQEIREQQDETPRSTEENKIELNEIDKVVPHVEKEESKEIEAETIQLDNSIKKPEPEVSNELKVQENVAVDYTDIDIVENIESENPENKLETDIEESYINLDMLKEGLAVPSTITENKEQNLIVQNVEIIENVDQITLPVDGIFENKEESTKTEEKEIILEIPENKVEIDEIKEFLETTLDKKEDVEKIEEPSDACKIDKKPEELSSIKKSKRVTSDLNVEQLFETICGSSKLKGKSALKAKSPKKIETVSDAHGLDPIIESESKCSLIPKSVEVSKLKNQLMTKLQENKKPTGRQRTRSEDVKSREFNDIVGILPPKRSRESSTDKSLRRLSLQTHDVSTDKNVEAAIEATSIVEEEKKIDELQCEKKNVDETIEFDVKNIIEEVLDRTENILPIVTPLLPQLSELVPDEKELSIEKNLTVVSASDLGDGQVEIANIPIIEEGTIKATTIVDFTETEEIRAPPPSSEMDIEKQMEDIVGGSLGFSDPIKKSDSDPNKSKGVSQSKLMEILADVNIESQEKVKSPIPKIPNPKFDITPAKPKTKLVVRTSLPSGSKSNKATILSEKIIKPASTESSSVSVQKITSKRSFEDYEDIDAYIIKKTAKVAAIENSPELIKKPLLAAKSKPKIINQTIITPAGKVIQPIISKTDDNVFDIDNMPIVLTDQLLTPESIENMQIIVQDTAQVPNKTIKKIVPQTQPQVKILNKSMPTSFRSLTPGKTFIKHIKPTQKVYQTSTPSGLKHSPTIISQAGKPGKFVIVPPESSTPTGSKYTVGKRPFIKKSPAILSSPTSKLQNVSSEPRGNKIMIVTNNQGQQSRVLLTPAQQKKIGYQTPIKKPTTIKGIVQKDSSKSPNIISQTIINSKGQITTTNTGLYTTPGTSMSQIRKTKIEPKKILGQKLLLHSQIKGPTGQQRTIIIKNPQGQTVKKIQGTDDALLEKQVAEQIEAINRAAGTKTNYKQVALKRASYPGKKPESKVSVNKQVFLNTSASTKTTTIPPLAPISPTKKMETTKILKPTPSVVREAEKQETIQAKQETDTKRTPHQLVIQDALGNQTTITEGQILALPSETVDGQPQSYMLVTLDETGNLTPLNNEALMSLDPNLGGDLSNMVLQIDQNETTTSVTPTTTIVSPAPAPEPIEKIKVEPTPPPPVVEPTPTTSADQNSSIPGLSINNGDTNQQLIITGDPASTQKFLESLTEGNADLANLLANAEGNILIQADGQQILINNDSENQMLLALNPDSLGGDNSAIFANQTPKNQDILAAALADTDVFQQEQQSLVPKVTQSQLSPGSGLYPMNVNNVLETSTMNSPIMSPLEIPSTNSKKIEADILSQVPKNVDLPITITDPNISQTVSQQQVALMASSDLELPLAIQDVVAVTSAGLNSPSFGYSLPSLDEKPFTGSISMPLLTEDPEDAASSLPNEIIQKDKSKLPVKEEYLLSTMSTQMCSSLSEPPPDMFDFGNMDPTFELEQKDVDIPVTSSDGFGVDKIHSPGAISTDDSVEIPVQPEIVTNTGSGSPKRSLDRKDDDVEESEKKKSKVD